MPYCTIEEAWSQSFNPDSEENTSDFKPYDEKYVPNKDVDLEPSNLYNEDGEKIACTKKMVVKKRVPNMSRTYNRLPEHTGNPSRFNDENLVDIYSYYAIIGLSSPDANIKANALFMGEDAAIW